MNAKDNGIRSGGRPVLEFSFRTDDLNEIPVKFAQPTVGRFARQNQNTIMSDPASELGGEDFNIG
jgi:hypothetical protein